MHKQNNIRNVTLISYAHHGKSTLRDLILPASIGKPCDANKNDNYSIPTSIGSSYIISRGTDEKLPEQSEGSEFLINLIGNTTSRETIADIYASIRLSDGSIFGFLINSSGSLIILDFIEDLPVQVENTLRLSLSERLVPVLVLNKVDTAFHDFGMDLEAIYQRFLRSIDSVNNIIHTSQDDLVGDMTLQPDRGNVCFCSGLQGWGFTVTQFAKLYSSKFGVHENRMAQRLWGDNFYDPETKKWTLQQYSESGKLLSRAFCKFILEPIAQIYKAVTQDKRDKLDKMIQKLGLTLETEFQGLSGLPLFKEIMKSWLPASKTLQDIIVQVTISSPGSTVPCELSVHRTSR